MCHHTRDRATEPAPYKRSVRQSLEVKQDVYSEEMSGAQGESGGGGFIPPHGRYRALLSYRKAEAIYDLTYHFCQRWLRRGDRTIDQMVQAARSGK